MKIFVTGGSGIWKPEDDFLRGFGEDVIALILREDEDVSPDCRCQKIFACPPPDRMVLGMMSAYKGRDSAFQRLAKEKDHIAGIIDFEEPIVILGDERPESLVILKVLQSFGKPLKIHVWTVLPAKIMGNKRVKGCHELLQELEWVQSLRLDSMDDIIDKVVRQTGPNTPFIKIFDIARENGRNGFEEYLADVFSFDSRKKYFFDRSSERFVETGEESGIDTMMPLRQNGKEICNMLRKIRVEFARKNHIEFESPECPYRGPCAGTCGKCDGELRFLEEAAKNMETVRYPFYDIAEDGFEFILKDETTSQRGKLVPSGIFGGTK